MRIKSALLSLIMVLVLLLGTFTSSADTTPTAEPTAEPATESAEESVVYTEEDYNGTCSDDTYVNEPFNLTVSVPEGWVSVADDGYLEMANMDATTDVALMVMNLEIEATDAHVTALLESLEEEQMSFLQEENATVSSDEIVSYMLAGRKVSLLWIEASDGTETSTFAATILCKGTYIMVIAAEYNGGDAHELLDLFAPLSWEASLLTTSPMGGYMDNAYVNPYFNFALTLEENWMFLSEENLATLNNIDYASLAGEDWESLIDDNPSLIIASAQSTDGAQAITFTLSALENASLLMDDAFMAESLAESIEPLTTTYANMGYTVDSMVVETAELMGKTLPCLHIVLSYSGSYLHETVVMIPGEQYLLTVALVNANTSADGLLNMFTPVSSPAGGYVGNQYVNPYFNFVLTAEENWEFLNEESLASLNNIDYASLAGEDWEELIASNPSLVIATAQSIDGAQAITFTLNSAEGAGDVMDDALIAESLAESIEPLTTTYTNMGYTVGDMVVETAKLMGKTVPCLHIVLSFNGSYLYETVVMLPGADYLMTIAFVNSNTSADELLPMVSVLDALAY